MTGHDGRDGSRWGVAGVWLIVAVVLLMLNWSNVVGGTAADGDDYMRLLEVRDWLAGQSWWDVSQHRMNPPVGGLMHWSRLVDLPLALVIAPLTPPFGQRVAEAVAVAVVPLATLALLMGIVAHVARRLFPALAAPVIAVTLLAATGCVTMQMYPSRIDHHGWQMVCAAAALAALIDPRPLRSGAVAGIALALWLDISIEGLPFAVAAAGAAALRWLMAPRKEGGRFALLLGVLAGGSALFFVATHAPSAWTVARCDAITPAHILVLTAAAVGATLMVRFAAAWRWQARAVLLALLGGVCAAGFVRIAPGCAGSPFGRLEPLVYDVWYLNVLEGLPIWRQPPMVAVNLVFFPLVGVAGCVLAWARATTPRASRDWLTIAILTAASLALAIMLRRAAGVAHVMAVPGALAIIEPLRARAGRFASPAARALGIFAAVCVPSPLTPVYANALLPASLAPPPRGDCDGNCSPEVVAALPPATFLTTLDAGPSLLALSHHRILAASYHRNAQPMGELIRAFTGDDATAHAIVRRHGIGYVLVSPRSSEADLYVRLGPRGLMASLLAGRPPAWLRPVPLATSGLRLWRVVG